MRKKKDEILKTHVLNLKEIRESEKNDKKKINKRRLIITTVIGCLLIITGVIYPKIAKNLKETEKNPEKKEDKNHLSCTANFENKVYNIKISVERTYNFQNEKLISSKTITTFTPIKNTSVENINSLYQKYNQLYSEPKNVGIIYKISYEEQKLIVTETINDYKNIDLNNYDQTLNTDNKSILFSSKNNYDDIKKQSEQLGSLCN